MHWVKISCILCMFGCFKDFRPSESFVTDYLTGPWKNFTDTQVNQEIYPLGTYAYFSTLVIVFLITDFARYKPIIILCGLSGAVAFLLMIFGQDVLTMQLVEFFYGLFLSTEVAYYTYIYAKVDKKHFQEVTGHTKAASLFGRCMAGVVAQLTTSFNWLDYHQLNYITLAAFTIGTIWAFFLPSVEQSMYFHRKPENYQNAASAQTNGTVLPQQSSYVLYVSERNVSNLSFAHKVKRAYSFLWKDFLHAYSNSHVVKWSAWWALSTCGYLQVTTYMQLIWQTAVEPGETIYNGAVDFLYAIIGAVTVFFISKVSLNWTLVGDVTVAFMSFLEGILLLLSSYTYNIWILYLVYIVFGIIYHTMVTVASFEVAKCICDDSYGLMFGINMFVALLLQSVLTAIVVNGNLSLNIRSQYYVYGGYFVAVAIAYMIIGIVNLTRHYRSGGEFKLWVKEETTVTEACGDGRRSSKSSTPSS